MSVKDNAEEVKSFALMPVGRAPDTGHRWHMHIAFVEDNLQPDPMMLRSGEEVVIDFKTRLLFNPAINTAKIRKKVELRIQAKLQGAADIGNVQAWHLRGYFTVCFDNVSHPVFVFTLQRRHQLGRRRFLIWICGRLCQAALVVGPCRHETITLARSILKKSGGVRRAM